MPQKVAYRSTPTSPAAPVPVARASAIEDLDDFLDEIDDLLEMNALEVVRTFIQKPGQ